MNDRPEDIGGLVAHIFITTTAAYKEMLEVLARHRQEAWIDYEQSRYSWGAALANVDRTGQLKEKDKS